LAAEKLLAVGPLVADDLSSLNQFRVVEAEGPALAADEILRLVEAIRPHMTDRSQGTAVVERVDPLGRILDDPQVVLAGDGHDPVHLAPHSGVVDRDDSPGPLGDRLLDQSIVEVEGVGPDVDEDRPGPEADEGTSRR